MLQSAPVMKYWTNKQVTVQSFCMQWFKYTPWDAFFRNKRMNRSKAPKMNWFWHHNLNYSVKSLIVVKIKNCFETKKLFFSSIAKRLRFLVRDAGFELWSSSIEWLTTCILSLYILYFISKCVLFSKLRKCVGTTEL